MFKTLNYRNPIGPSRPIRPSSPPKINCQWVGALCCWYCSANNRNWYCDVSIAILVLWYIADVNCVILYCDTTKSSRTPSMLTQHCRPMMRWSRHLENADTAIRCSGSRWSHTQSKPFLVVFQQNSRRCVRIENAFVLRAEEGHIKHTLSQ